jgi:hypothetical protein
MLAQSFPLETTKGLTPNKTLVRAVEHQSLKAVRVTPSADSAGGEDQLVVIDGAKLKNGTIELEMSGAPGAGAGGGARGFVGVAFRLAPDLSKYDAFYIRPTNGRVEDQVRRNHSVQYISYPEFPWHRLRKEFPEMYESYADLQPAVWTKVRITIDGAKARLFLHGNEQPTLIVNDLKQAPVSGGIALWIGPGTDAHFRNLRVTAKD